MVRPHFWPLKSMNAHHFKTHKLINLLHSVALIAAMALLLGTLGWLLFGPSGLTMIVAGIAVSLLFNPTFSPGLILRLYRAVPLSAAEAPRLMRMIEALAWRAGLEQPPRLYYIPSTTLNALTVGPHATAAIAITDGILRELSPRELNGVLAHEISHIRNNDIWVMGLADLFSRMTGAFCTLGQFLLLVNLPLLFFSDTGISWLAILLLLFAPAVSLLIQLALSRTREFDADLDGAALTGDPEGLATALAKIERRQRNLLEQLLFPGEALPESAWLRTHPPTPERIRRLRELAPARAPAYHLLHDSGILPPQPRAPRWPAGYFDDLWL
jgi:heat shock protein HtpX